ncbi:MAG: PDZ domain-containing protein [Actinobacteria bacterium]|nr:PDZ domain-containing protein [Actinomycetota bacterium]
MSPSRKPFRWLVWFGLAGFVAAIVAGFSIPLPYYTIAPGQALDVRPFVKVESGPNDHSEGQFFLTTVSLGQANLFQALAGWVDSSVDVIEESAIRPPSVSPDELTKLNLEQMANSKQIALGVAFEYLGYDAISGDGAKIVGVEKGSPADSFLRVGEVITAVNGAVVNDHFQLVKIVRATRPGSRVALDVQAVGGGGERRVDIELGSNPTNVEQGFLGVQLSTHNLRFDFPYKLKLESERIGGPSAGLAYTLQVLDVLTEGDLAAGRKVAVTGTIELDGTVGEVGGVAQKAVAVRDAKADVFLVPSAEREAVKRAIGKKVEVVGVDSLTDAIAVLERMGGKLRPMSADQVARSVRSGT